MTSRRETLQRSAAVAALLASAGFPQFAQAATHKAAFEAKTVPEAVKATGALTLIESKDVVLTAPDIAENGAFVPMGVSTALPGVKHVLLLVEKNPLSLVALFQSSESLENNFLTRAKMGQTSDVYAVAVMADGKALWTKKEVKVTLGGCGG